MAVRWVTIAQYSKMTGLSREIVKRKMNEGELIWTTSDGGGKYLIKVESNEEVESLKKELAVLTEMVTNLSKHLGLSIPKTNKMDYLERRI